VERERESVLKLLQEIFLKSDLNWVINDLNS